MLDKEGKNFDVKFTASLEEDQEPQKPKKFNTKVILAIIALLLLMVGGWFIYKNIVHNEEKTIEESLMGQIFFLDLEPITVNLRAGSENNLAWLRIKVTLEVKGQNNYDLLKKMTPKVMDVFQTYLKELKKSDLDGSFGIYKIKDEMMMRINVILAPTQIENILFQEFILQGA
jgi:flagellar FliL protein